MRFGTGRVTHKEVWDMSGDTPRGTGWVEGPSEKSRTGRGNLG